MGYFTDFLLIALLERVHKSIPLGLQTVWFSQTVKGVVAVALMDGLGQGEGPAKGVLASAAQTKDEGKANITA